MPRPRKTESEKRQTARLQKARRRASLKDSTQKTSLQTEQTPPLLQQQDQPESFTSKLPFTQYEQRPFSQKYKLPYSSQSRYDLRPRLTQSESRTTPSVRATPASVVNSPSLQNQTVELTELLSNINLGKLHVCSRLCLQVTIIASDENYYYSLSLIGNEDNDTLFEEAEGSDLPRGEVEEEVSDLDEEEIQATGSDFLSAAGSNSADNRARVSEELIYDTDSNEENDIMATLPEIKTSSESENDSEPTSQLNNTRPQKFDNTQPQRLKNTPPQELNNIQSQQLGESAISQPLHANMEVSAIDVLREAWKPYCKCGECI